MQLVLVLWRLVLKVDLGFLSKEDIEVIRNTDAETEIDVEGTDVEMQFGF